MTEQICKCGHDIDFHVSPAAGCMYPQQGIVDFSKVTCPCKKFTPKCNCICHKKKAKYCDMCSKNHGPSGVKSSRGSLLNKRRKDKPSENSIIKSIEPEGIQNPGCGECNFDRWGNLVLCPTCQEKEK